ncbi:MAG: deoxynucleoside kinase [Flavobacteriales bacterium]
MTNQFIAVEGNIGSGKTSFSKLLSKELNCKLILEEFADNPFLPKFYNNPERYAFSLELFFMAERYRQLGEVVTKDLFSTEIVSDYFFNKSKLFAQVNLRDDELRLFNMLTDIAFRNLPRPDLILYLHSDVSRLQHNISKRGRTFEQGISDDYLISIQDMYFDYFRKQSEFPVVLVDVSHYDFVTDKNVFNKITSLSKETYDIGFHKVSI